MPTEAYNNWFRDTIAPRLRTAVSPITWPLYAERESLRAEREIHLTRIDSLEHIGLDNLAEITRLNARVAELERLLAGCENEPEPEPSKYDGGRIRVAWATGTVVNAVAATLSSIDATHCYATVITADVVKKEGSAAVIAQIDRLRGAGVKVYAYVRVLHCRTNERGKLTNVSEAVPFEHAVGELVAAHEAYAYGVDGKPIFHSGGYDVYIDLAPIAEEHAALVMQHVCDPTLWDGILADGLMSEGGHIYPGSGVDWNRNGIADVTEYGDAGWLDTLMHQYDALDRWRRQIDFPIIGNGAGYPPELLLDGSVQLPAWAYGPVLGAYNESPWYPMYPWGDETKQGPPTSERWAMWQKVAQNFADLGQEFWTGDIPAPFDLPEDQRQRFLISSALMVDAKVVMADHPWLRLSLGKPLGPYGDGFNLQTRIRTFEGGIVRCFPDRIDGEIQT